MSHSTQNENELLQTAYDLGFSAAALIDTSQIIFEPAFRICCEDNSCGMYGVNYACPPDCGTADEMRDRILAHRKAFFLQTIWEAPDLEDKPLMKSYKKKHNSMLREFAARLPENIRNGFLIAASGCTLCPECAIVKKEPCRFPDQKTSCASAYCIYVKALAESLGIEYDMPSGLVAFFGMYVFD